MAWPLTAILDVLVEMQLSTMEWTDITTYVYGDPEAERITYQRGRTSEAFAVEPSVLNIKLNNQDGRFSYRNPRSAYYGLIGRNTPVRLSVRPRLTTGTVADLSDAFGRTVAAGNTWGASDTGQTWNRTTATLASKLSVSSGSGRMLMSSATDAPGALVASAKWKDFDAYMTFTLPVATGDSLFSTISGRVSETTDSNRGQRLRCEVTTAGVVKLLVLATNPEGLTATVSTTTISGLTHTGQALRMRMRLAGITVMGKVWDAANAEPASWQVTRDDTTTRIAKPPGSIVITTQAGAANSNTPFTALYDNVAITAIEPVVCAELTSLPVRWSKGAPNSGTVWNPVSAHGILARMANTSEQGKSPLWRFVEDNSAGLQGFWTLGVGEPAGLAGAEFQRPMLGTVAARAISTGGAAVMESLTMQHLAAAQWLEPGVQFANSVGAVAFIDRASAPDNSGAGWSIDWVRAGSTNTDAANPEHVIVNTNILGAAAVSWNIEMSTVATFIITDPNGSTHTAADSVTTDGGPHAFRFTTAKSGANITYNLYVDGSSVLSGSVVAPDSNGAGKISTPEWFAGGAQVVTYSHITIWDTSAPTALAWATAALGYAGELAADRIIRVCQERDIAYYVLGSTTEECGPQPIGTDYQVIYAAAAADQGVLGELTDAPGILYYGRATLYHQSATAFTYTTDGHLQEVPEPTDDDASLANVATVTRQFASSKTYEQTTGTLSTANPPTGVGRKALDLTLNMGDDDRVLSMAQWLVALGTVDDSRWPNLNVSLGHMATHGLYSLLVSAMRTDGGYRVTVAGPPTFLPPGTVDQLVVGLSGTIDQYNWLIDYNCAPFEVYGVGIWDGGSAEFAGLWDSDTSTLAAGATSTATSLSVATTGSILWTTSAGDFPFDVNISGVRITVTNVSGATSPQTFTVTRSVDGFDIALASGASVRLWRPSKWGL